jgi:hypothetical protein
MPIEYLDWITRSDVQMKPEARFVFGDNWRREGFGGQAKSMRGEPNAIGVATKWSPDMGDMSFFSDGSAHCETIVLADLGTIEHALSEGRTVYVPKDGLGTGLSQLPQRAPKLYAALLAFFVLNSPQGCPWPK